MPRRRAGVPYASSSVSTGRLFIDTTGQPSLGIAICQRCQTKRMLAELCEDGNIKGFMVCKPNISAGCWDTYDPFRLPAPPPDRYDLPFVRPDGPLTVPAADAAQLPLQPPGPTPNPGPAWSFSNGVNIMWPFLGPLVNDPNDPETTYQSNPFTNPSNWNTHVDTTVIGILQRGGFDHVRIPVVPSVWMEALQDSNTARIEYLFTLFDSAMSSMTAAGFGVVIDLHQQDYVITQYFVNNILSDQTLFNVYTQVVRLFCNRYRRLYTPAQVAFSLFNEPPDQSLFTLDWPTCLMQLYTAARQIAPAHTLFLTASSYSQLTPTIAFNPTPWLADTNVRWDVHLYLPPQWAIQGQDQGSVPFFSKFVTDLDWPPLPADEAGVVADMTTMVNADPDLTAPQKTTQITYSTEQIGFVYSNNPPFSPQNATWLAGQFDLLVGWQRTYNVSLYCGEWGCTRTNVNFTGASQPNREAYWTDIAPLIRGTLPAAMFALDAIDYGITTGTGQNIDVFTQQVLDIISPGGTV